MKAMRPMVHIFEDAAYVTLGAIFVVDDGAAWGPWCPLYQPERINSYLNRGDRSGGRQSLSGTSAANHGSQV